VLTRLHVHGFKNLLDFQLDFHPFNCIAGPNGVGKSNIFDVIRFLSFLADHTLMDAALKLRESDPETADISDIFWNGGSNWRPTIKITAEMIVDGHVRDDFGRQADATSTYLQYTVHIGYRPPTDEHFLGALTLEHESLEHIKKADAVHRLTFAHSASAFRDPLIWNYRKSSSGYISTHTTRDQITEIHIHQDGGSRGGPSKIPAHSAPGTVIGTTNTVDTPTILAAKREMHSWRLLALEPTAMRRVDRFHSPSRVATDGSHLPATLYRLAQSEQSEEEPHSSHDPTRIYAHLTSRLAAIIPVRDIRVERDDSRRILTLLARESHGEFLPARSLSDGTLRFLALCVILFDTEFRGALCMEEPENGIHPGRIKSMVELLRDIAVDPTEPVGEDNPLRQVIVATHSPLFVQLQNPDEVIYADTARRLGPDGYITRSLEPLPLSNSSRANRHAKTINRASIYQYLSVHPDAQLRLDFDPRHNDGRL